MKQAEDKRVYTDASYVNELINMKNDLDRQINQNRQIDQNREAYKHKNNKRYIKIKIIFLY